MTKEAEDLKKMADDMFASMPGPEDQKIIVFLITKTRLHGYPRHSCPDLESALVDGIRAHLAQERPPIVEAHMLSTVEAYAVTDEQLQSALTQAVFLNRATA